MRGGWVLGVIAIGCGHSAKKVDEHEVVTPAPDAGVPVADASPHGTLTIRSSFPCEVVFNGKFIEGELPQTVEVPPGRHDLLCVSERYEFGLWEDTEVRIGERVTLTFSWVILVNRLENPLGRIVVENPSETGQLLDLGVSSSEVGVPVPDGDRPLKLILRDDTGADLETRDLVVEAGRTYDITWSAK